jgi:FtsP/CotA-like multicopper oxidase with cupredoxin domain
LVPIAGRPYHPVVTLNGWSLPFRMNAGVKEFTSSRSRSYASWRRHEARLWGYNGQSPGPTIEVVEGDRVRIFVTNKLPEHTSIHWHGQRLPNGMDGVSGLTQAPSPRARRSSTNSSPNARAHSCTTPRGRNGADGDGDDGLLGHASRDRKSAAVDRDFVFLLAAYDIDPGSATPRIMTMLDFNLWTFNSRVFPGIDSMPVRLGDRVRIRIGNLTMTNHPIHIHGHEFEIAGTDGGWVPRAARWPEVTTDVGVGQMRAVEFDAIAKATGRSTATNRTTR